MKILLLSLVLVLVSCSGGRNSTGYSLINDMMHSKALEAFAPSKHFSDGKAMQPAVEGTIARGWMPGEMDADGNLMIMKNPMTSGRTTSSVENMSNYQWERGKLLYEKNCSHCHGVKGGADGLVVTKGGFPAPPKFSARRWRKTDKETGDYIYPSGHVYKIITEGYGNMKSHAQQLYPEDRWLVSEYVREFLMRGGKYYKKDMKKVLGE